MFRRTLFALSLVSIGASLAAAQATFKTPRTPWGDPDLQGRWPAVDMQGTPFERPSELGTQAQLTDEQLAERRARARAQITPQSWAERQANPSRQSSLVVDPPDGKIPPMTPASRASRRRAAPTSSTFRTTSSPMRSTTSRTSARTIAASRAA